jgi:hypothetical protein
VAILLPPVEGRLVTATKRIQVQVRLPYNREPRNDERVRGYLNRGWRIAQLQRLSDQEAVITFEADAAVDPR